MKKIILLFFISISINSFSQDLFTSDLDQEFPTAIQVVDNYLYVATWNAFNLYRITINDPTNIEIVAKFNGPMWKMDYDSSNNDLYCSSVNSLSSVDLELNNPISPVTLANMDLLNGLEIEDNIIYMTDDMNIYSYDISLGISSRQIFYTDTDGYIRNPRVYNNELYYELNIPGRFPIDRIYKIDIANPSAQKVLVASNLGGIVQSSLIVDNFLYLGTEGTSKLLRLDLSTTNLPLTPVVVLDNLGTAGIIGLANKNSTIYFTSGFGTIHTYEDTVLSINNIIQNPISIYPNPTNGKILIDGVLPKDVSYSIYTLTGFKVKEDQLKNSINTSDLSSGIYILKFFQYGYIQTERIIKTD